MRFPPRNRAGFLFDVEPRYLGGGSRTGCFVVRFKFDDKEASGTPPWWKKEEKYDRWAMYTIAVYIEMKDYVKKKNAS